MSCSSAEDEGYPSVKHGRDFELSGVSAQLNVTKTLFDMSLGFETKEKGKKGVGFCKILYIFFRSSTANSLFGGKTLHAEYLAVVFCFLLPVTRVFTTSLREPNAPRKKMCRLRLRAQDDLGEDFPVWLRKGEGKRGEEPMKSLYKSPFQKPECRRTSPKDPEIKMVGPPETLVNL